MPREDGFERRWSPKAGTHRGDCHVQFRYPYSRFCAYQRANFRGFRMVALRMGNAEVKELMGGISWIDVADGEFTADIALAILRALHPSENQHNPASSRDVYVSAS